jgi:chitodextrinase
LQSGQASFVQANSMEAGSPATSLNLPMGTVRQGDLLVGWFLQYDSSGPVHVSDNVNGAWTRSASERFGGGTGDVALYYVANARAGPTTITISADNATYLQGTASEYAGISPTNPLAATAVSAATSATATSGPTPSVPAGDLVYGAVQTGVPPGSEAAGSSDGYAATLRTQVSDGTDGSEDVLSGAAGQQAPSMWLSTSTNWFMVGAVFTPAPVGPADTAPPSVPRITSDSVSGTVVTLNWSASTDNVGVAGYTIHRNGAVLATVGGAVLSFSDSTVAAGTTYTYTIDAFDVAGNHSSQSNPVTVSTPAPPPTTTLAPTPTTARSTSTTTSPPPSGGLVKGIMRFSTTNWSQLAGAGFNTSSDGNDSGTLSAQAAVGMNGLVWLGSWDHTSCSWEYSDAQAVSIVQSVMGSPTVVAFELGDEPLQTPCANAPSAYAQRTALIHSIDPHGVTMTIDDELNNPAGPPATILMKGTVDVLAFDVYPCQDGQACQFGMISSAIKTIHAQAITRWWAVMQDFAGEGWRFPTNDELTTEYSMWRGSGMSGYLVFAWDYLGNSVTSVSGNVQTLQQNNATF